MILAICPYFLYFLLFYIRLLYSLSNAQQSYVPATALGVWLFVNRLRTESIDFSDQGTKKIDFGVPGTENIDFCVALETENIEF